MSDYYNMFHSRQFSERNRIIFQYPPNQNGDDILIFLPFYENPKITESQSANYAEYNPIARAGSLYAYTGSTSRKIKVQMYLTLPHLAMHEMGLSRFMRIFQGTSAASEKLLFTSKSKISSESKPGDATNSLTVAVDKMYNLLVNENLGGAATGGEKLLQDLAGNEFLAGLGINVVKDTINAALYTERQKILDTLLFFLALLRTSVVNNAQNPLEGPPLLRLDFGTLYQSVPCICKSYNINWEEDAGYDMTSITPRRISISLNLEEIRVGDFSTYAPAVMVERDNLAGWESAISSPHTTDPLPAGGFWKGGS
jgi:hypothetical protein